MNKKIDIVCFKKIKLIFEKKNASACSCCKNIIFRSDNTDFKAASAVHSLALIVPGSGRTVKYWGLLSFDLAFTRSKLNSPGICVVYH
jgi:hypothetical protein